MSSNWGMEQLTHLHPWPQLSPWVELKPSLPHMPAWRAQAGTILAFSMCLKVVNEHYIATEKLICCLCSLHLFVRWSIRKKFLSYIFINTVYFIPGYSQICAEVWTKVEGSFIYYQNQETSVIIKCVQKTTAEYWVICLCTEDHCWVVNV
jgi:hypothetical protein